MRLQPQIKGETDEYHGEEHCNGAAVEEFVADAAREEEAELSEAVKGGFFEAPLSHRQQQRRVEGELSQEAREGPPSKKPKQTVQSNIYPHNNRETKGQKVPQKRIQIGVFQKAIVEILSFTVDCLESFTQSGSELGEGISYLLAEKHSLFVLEGSDFLKEPLRVVAVVSVMVGVELISIEVYHEPQKAPQEHPSARQRTRLRQKFELKEILH